MKLRFVPIAKKLKGKIVHVGDFGEAKITNDKKDTLITYVREEDGSKRWYLDTQVDELRGDYPLKYAFAKRLRKVV